MDDRERLLRAEHSINMHLGRLGQRLRPELFDPLSFTLIDGADAIVDEYWPYQVANVFKNNYYAASAPTNMTDGMLYMKSTTGVVYGRHSSLMIPINKDLITIKTDDYTIPSTGFNQTWIMDSTDAKIFNLPAITATHIGCWFWFIKYNTGRLTLNLPAGNFIRDVVSSSSNGGTAYNVLDTRASIYLKIIKSTEYFASAGRGAMWIYT